MEIKTYLLRQFTSQRQLVDSALQGLTDEQLTWLPPGTANPIGVIILHMLASEDYFISLLTGKDCLWESQKWAEKFNLAKPPDIGEDWSVYRSGTITLDLLLSFRDAVRKATDSYFETVTSAELDRTIKFFTDNDPVADVLILLDGHNLTHAGEIAALKGVYGVKGLPY